MDPLNGFFLFADLAEKNSNIADLLKLHVSPSSGHSTVMHHAHEGLLTWGRLGMAKNRYSIYRRYWYRPIYRSISIRSVFGIDRANHEPIWDGPEMT
jgi:hypothetical protein